MKMSMELWWNDNDKGNPIGEQFALVTLSPPQDLLGIKPGLPW
jgi:hypothetical protein